MTIFQKHYYGFSEHVFKDKDIKLKDALYQAIRECYNFLTEDNHTYEIKGSRVNIRHSGSNELWFTPWFVFSKDELVDTLDYRCGFDIKKSYIHK